MLEKVVVESRTRGTLPTVHLIKRTLEDEAEKQQNEENSSS